ncbi:MAG TPA: SMP-30/gluconolactonase/LRE family protein [Actinomycetota bacterium]|nr:SMP-30/gluconolactonase/LRE family protein [Actinomycetota bacterium]
MPVELRVLVEGLDHPEGVAVAGDGSLWAGGEAGQLYRIAEASAEQVATTGGFLLGLAVDGSGSVFACDVAARQVARIEPESGRVEVHSRGTPQRPMVNPNWPVFDGAGNLYVTDSGRWKGNDGCIFRIDASGVTTVWSEASTNFPNGACLDASGKWLLVLESLPPALVRIRISDDGTAGEREVVAELRGTVPDGVCLDEDGLAYVCCYRPDRILTVDPDGGVDVFADDPEGTILSAPTNGVFCGNDLRTLVTGNLGRWHLTACEPGPRGLPLRYPVLG